RLASRDLTHHLGVDDAAAELSDLAAGTLDAALAIARQRVGQDGHSAGQEVRLAVIAMGKCGGHELNYVSDVDVIFVHEAADGADADRALRTATQLASHLIRICSEHTAEGTIWPVDAALRPEGKAGPLTRTLASHQGYYERWASTWEFQALLKARAVAGDLELGRAYVAMVQPMVWSAVERDGFVEDTQAMRRRVIEHIPAHHAERQLKLGSGGLRDVEFAIQLLQLVHGRADESIRSPTTLSALAELIEGGYVGRDDGEALHAAYAFLRTLEHRIQLYQLRRTHVVPEDEPSLRRLGRSMGYTKDAVATLNERWQHHRREVRRLHEKLFYRPLLTAVARLDSDEARLTPEAATQRLAALGFADPAAALRHLESLTSGVTRTANIQRQLLPAMLDWFADAPDPDAGLFGFRRISESLGRTPWYLKTLRDEGEVAERLARLLATSRYVSDLLEKEPAGVRMLGEDLTPLESEPIVEEMLSAAGRRDDPEAAVRAIRAVRRRELFRVAAGDTLGLVDVADVGAALSRITDATLEATLRVVMGSIAEVKQLAAPPVRMAIVAMGRYGGFELSYGSDADVLFVHEPRDGVDQHEASSYAIAVAHELRRLLA
ncbi:MAG TPA: bifunctional [glutamine synthetase] adenylyltransferase/[glutamine synthetase]-adenylyl-L-tyrosine phosphorylase, partial [Nocardioides sp.]|nr:bifunctional [glutamine synthetase] adenylyltransferase/[glutamine synthetase]-adenylyl-L-tyrosine phosphorylase [Nocardioides sp.]